MIINGVQKRLVQVVSIVTSFKDGDTIVDVVPYDECASEPRDRAERGLTIVDRKLGRSQRYELHKVWIPEGGDKS